MGYDAVLYLEGFAGFVRSNLLGQHPLSVFGMERPEPMLLVYHLRFCRVPENGFVLGAHVGHSFGIGGLKRLLNIGDCWDLFHKCVVEGLSLPQSPLRLLTPSDVPSDR